MIQSDILLLKEIQRNTEMAISAIEALAEKIEDDKASYQLERQNLVFSSLHDHACRDLVQANIKPAPSNVYQNFMLKSGVQMRTMFDTSASHIAEMMIQGNTKGITSLCKTLNQQKNVKYIAQNHDSHQKSFAVELAQELMAFEESCIEKWKDFL